MPATPPSPHGGEVEFVGRRAKHFTLAGVTKRARRSGRHLHVRWRPGVRLVLALVVLAPAVSVAFLTASTASSQWTNREDAQVVARDAAQLQAVASARADVNAALIPTMAITFGGSLGITESTMSSLLGVNFPDMFDRTVPPLNTDPTFESTPTLKAVTAEFLATLPTVKSGHVDFRSESDLAARFCSDLDDLWFADFEQLQHDMGIWQPPGSFEVHLSALRLTYLAFLSGEYSLEGAFYTLEGVGQTVVVDPKDGYAFTLTARQEALWFTNELAQVVGQFGGELGPLGQAAWTKLQDDPKVQLVEATVKEGTADALNSSFKASLNQDTLKQTGIGQIDSLVYLRDLDALVQDASQDLLNAATAQAKAATEQFAREIAFLLALVVVSLGGVLVAGNSLSRPVKRLAGAAHQIQEGEFALEQLPDTGPREVVTTTTMFNDMASTLKAVEAKVVALSTEDLAHPELLVPLPGRTGQALQAAVDRLSARNRERELQRQQLHRAATHDRLTDILNRAAVLDFLTNDVNRRRQAGETVAVLFVDLDGLKPLNDNFGHEAGDAAIKAAAEALGQATGHCDVIGRLGGDEFLAVLCAEHSTDAATVSANIRTEVAKRTVSAKGEVLPLRCSVGLALAQCDGDTDPAELVRQADEAMYEAKVAARATRDQLAAATVQGAGEHS